MAINTKKLTSPYRSIGFWLAIVIGLSQAINAVRAFADPAAFATYVGLPLQDMADAGFVQIYGLRAGFIALLVLLFAALKRIDAMAWMALAAIVMPIGDTILVMNAGAPQATIIRHIAIGLFVLVTFMMLRRAANAQREDV